MTPQEEALYHELYASAQEADITRAQDILNRGKEIRTDFWELLPGRMALREALTCAARKGFLPFVRFMCDNTSVTPHGFIVRESEKGECRRIKGAEPFAESPLITVVRTRHETIALFLLSRTS